MCESQLTEPEFYAEGLNDIILRNRPMISNIWPKVFSELNQSSLVSVQGSRTSIGAYMMELIARILIRNDESKVLFVNIEQHFNIWKLTEICMQIMQQQNDDREQNKVFIELQLKKLYILDCDEKDFAKIGDKMGKILTDLTDISLVLIDSLGTFYYSEASKRAESGRPLYMPGKDTYLALYLKEFKILAKKYETTFVCAIPEYMNGSTEHQDKFTTHVITITEENDSFVKSFVMKIKHKNLETKLLYTIEWFGLNFL